MPRPIVQVFQEFQNAVVPPIEPTFKTVIIGPNKHIKDYPEDKDTIRAVDSSGDPLDYGILVESLMSASTPSPTPSAVVIPEAPDNTAGGILEDATVTTFIDEAYAEMESQTDGTVTYQQNTLDTSAGDFSKVQVGDRVIMTPNAVQIFEDLNEDFTSLVAGTDILKIAADQHGILKVLSKHRLLVQKSTGGDVNTGLFAAADGTPIVSYVIGDNSPTFDNEIGAGTTGQRIVWKKVELFQDLVEDFVSNGVSTSHYLKIGTEIHKIAQVIDAHHLLVDTTVTAPATLGEFASADGSPTTAYSIGTTSGQYKDIIDNSLTDTNGQRLASDSIIGRVYEINSATQITLNQFIPFHSDAGVEVNFRVEHNLLDSEKPVGTDGWSVASTVNPTTKTITVGAGETVTYLAASRKVQSAKIYVEYISLRTDTAAEIFEVSADDIDSKLGADDSRNPLRRAAGIAIANAGAARIYVLALTSDDISGHTAAQQITSNDRDVYCECILNTSSSIIASWKNHAETLSTPLKGKRRLIVAQGGSLPTTKQLSSGTDGDAESATVFFSSTEDFVADGVAPGDTLKVTILGPITNEYTVDTVLSGNRLSITGSFTAGEQSETNVVYEVNRALDKNGQVTELSATPQSLNSSRVVLCWPDEIEIGSDTSENGYYLAAATSGMIAAFPSQRPLTNVSIAGIDKLKNANNYFNDDQMDALIDAGWFVFQQETPSSAPYVLQQYTTKGVQAIVGERYVSTVKNFDYVARTYQDVLNEFPGDWNVIPELFGALEDSVRATSESLISQKVPKIGPPLLGTSDLRIEPSATLSDKVEIYLKVQLPNVLDKLDMHLISV